MAKGSSSRNTMYKSRGRTSAQKTKRQRRPKSLPSTASGTMLVCSAHTTQMPGLALKKTIHNLKKAHGMSMGASSVRQMEYMLRNVTHFIASKASIKKGRRKTLSEKHIARAVQLSLPHGIRERVMAKAKKALQRYKKSFETRNRN